MNLFLFAVAAVTAIFVIDRFVRARTERLRQTGLYPPAGQGTDADVERLVRARRKIAAIKLYRKIHGGGLKDAKDAVEQLLVGLESESSGSAIEP